jgi:transcriptional regulator with XRE-family HTH domain
MKKTITNIDTTALADELEVLLKNKCGSVDSALRTTNLNKSVVDNIRKGSLPNIAILKNVATFLEVSADYLLGLTENPAPAQNLSEQSTTSKIQILFDMLPHAEQVKELGNIKNILHDFGHDDEELERIFPLSLLSQEYRLSKYRESNEKYAQKSEQK